MKTNPLLKSFFLLLILTGLIWSCGKDLEESNLHQNTTNYSSLNMADKSIEAQNFAKKNLARELSLLVAQNPELFDLFDEKIKKTRATGYIEEEFFWNVEKKIQSANSRNESFSDLLINTNDENAFLLDYLCQNIPALTILKTGNLESDEVSQRVYVDTGVDDNDERAEIIYYENGVESSQLISEEPTTIVYIVRESEVNIPDLNAEYVAHTIRDIESVTTDCGSVMHRWAVPPPPPPPPPPSAECDIEGCERDCEDGKENILKFKTNQDHDDWNRGKTGEFIFYTIFGSNVSYQEVNGQIQISGNALDYVIHRMEGVHGDDEWIYVNWEIIRWDLDNQDGDRMKHIVYEDDGGNIVNINTSLTMNIRTGVGSNGTGTAGSVNGTASTTFQVRDGDDFLGESIVDYCDDIYNINSGFETFQYNPGSGVSFHMSER